jgi:squalene synthase HpnC
MPQATGFALAQCPYRVSRDYSPREARDYCRRIAVGHYENFLVAGLICPRRLRQHAYNLYAYCRIADDLGDETRDPDAALELLDWWESELDAMLAGSPRHPVFVALSETVAQLAIPDMPFRRLLSAFRQDQTTTRYATFEQLLAYCERSANPVGHLVLALGGYQDEERKALADDTCTALQLANFWQDVSRDWDKGRLYIPQEDTDRFGVTEEQIAARTFTPEFAQLMMLEIERARRLFDSGAGLAPMLDRRLRLNVEMFTEGGMEVLRRIEAQGYDVLTSRPSITKRRQAALLLKRLLTGTGLL